MIAKLLSIALALTAMTSLTSCLSNSHRAARAQYERDDTTIWNESSRYGAYQEQQYYYPRAGRYEGPSGDGSFNTYTGVDRYGRRYYEGGYSDRPRLNEDSSGYPMISQSAPTDDRGYGSGGFTPTSPRSAARDRPTFDGPPAPKMEKKKEEAPAPKKNNFDNLPYASPVPGRSGFVTLKSHPNLPEIDVTGIAPGTPVEIPNPSKPGDTIQFRVP